MSESVSRFDETVVAQDERLRALASYGPVDMNPEAVLDGLVQLAARLCEAPVGLITLVDDVRQVFKAGVGYEGPPTAPLEAGFCPIVVEQGEPVVIPDTLADPAHADNVAARDGGVRFYAGVPLLADGQHVLGTLCVLDTAPRPAGLTQAQLDVLLTLSTQVVSHFELRRSLAQRDTLLAEQRANIQERDALARVQAAITTADGDLDTILAALVCNAMAAVPAADGGVLELIDGDVLEYRAVRGTLERHRGLRVPLRGSLAGSCAEANEPALVNDVHRDGRAVRELIEPLQLHAAVLAPVARGGQVLGVLKLQSSKPGVFGPRDLEVLRLFAGVATAGLTEVRAAEGQKSLLAGARRQQAILDSAVDFAIIATDRDGSVTDWNIGAERVLGWTAGEMRGDTVERIFTPEDRTIDRAGTEMRIALEHGRASDERWHLRRDGSRFWASGEMMPLQDGQDRHIGFLKILRDRTAEHEAGKALREAEADLQRAQVAGGVGIFTVPVSDNILKVTPEFCRIFGLPVRERMAAEEVEHLVLPEDAHLASNTARRADGGLQLDVEYRIRRADTGAVRWLSRRSEIERDGAGTAVRFFGVVRDITDQRANLDALARSEKLARENVQRVQLALEAGAIVGTWFWDLPTDRFTIDEAFAATFGLDPALGRDGIPLAQIVATVHPDDQAGLAEAINEAIGRGGRYAHQYRVRRHDGQYYWIEANGHVEHAEDGTPLRFPGVLLDIEERRAVEMGRERAVAALRDLNATLERQVVERSLARARTWQVTPDLLAVINGSGRFEATNPAWTATLGWAEEELTQAAFMDFVHPDDQAATQEAWAYATERGLPVLSFQNRYRHRDGGWRWLSWVGVPDDGKVYGSARDVTLEVEQANSLRESQAREQRSQQSSQRTQAALAAGAIMGTWNWNLTDDFFTFDEGFALAFGHDPASAQTGLPIDQVLVNVHPEDRPGLDAAIAETIARGGSYARQYRVRRADGRYHWIEANGRVDHDAGGKASSFPGFIINVDERASLEAERDRATAELRTLSDTLELRVAERTSELMQAEEALRQSQKLEAIGQLTGGVAHDFNNLLTVIKSASHMLKRPGITEGRRTRYVDAISDTVDRAAKLTGQLLAFARRQALKPEVFAACDGVRGLVDMLGTLTGSRVRVVTELPESRCFVNADASQFETALVNLAVNARDAMEGEGGITVTVKAIDRLPSIRAHEPVLGPHVAISMADTGAGIPADMIGRIFEPFFTTKEIGKGTGLGLSQVFGFAKQSGGDVEVASTVGQGTIFTIYLPQAAAPERDKVEQEPDMLLDGHGLHVLVVEDNADVGTFAQGTLNDLGYATVLATDGAAALAELARTPDRFDVVFSDVMMPGMSGIELAQEICLRYPNVPVVLTSGYSQVLAQDGTHGFELLQKPYSVDQLSRMLRKVVSLQRQERRLDS